MSLSIEPAQLVFDPPFTRSITKLLNLRNSGPRPLVFKVKTTAPKRYCVRPNAGIISPNETKIVQVIFQSKEAIKESGSRTKDKFLVQSAVAAEGAIMDASFDVSDFLNKCDPEALTEYKIRSVFGGIDDVSGSPVMSSATTSAGGERSSAAPPSAGSTGATSSSSSSSSSAGAAAGAASPSPSSSSSSSSSTSANSGTSTSSTAAASTTGGASGGVTPSPKVSTTTVVPPAGATSTTSSSGGTAAKATSGGVTSASASGAETVDSLKVKLAAANSELETLTNERSQYRRQVTELTDQLRKANQDKQTSKKPAAAGGFGYLTLLLVILLTIGATVGVQVYVLKN